MPVKVMRYQIVKPVDADWELLGKVLRDLQDDTRKVLNKVIQLCWEWQGFSAEYKQQYGIYPKTSDFSHYKNIDGYCYKKISDFFTRLHTGNLSMTIKRGVQRWKTDLAEVIKGSKSIASFRSNCPIDIHNKSINIFNVEKEYYAKLSLLSKTYKKELSRDLGQITVLINPGDKSGKDILDRCISGEYKISSSQILQKKDTNTSKNNKWLLNLSYSFKSQKKIVDSNKVLGIDMGIIFPVYMAIHGTLIRDKIDGGEIEHFRKEVENRKIKLQRQGKYCGQGRIGHGTKTRVRPIEFAKEKIANFRNTVNHKYSRYIVDFALRNRCGIIQMEKLEGINKDKTFLKSWPYYDLQQKIIYKANEAGITVKFIDPRYTSQRCSKCGYIDEENRPEQKTFICKSCGFETNADYNAALNIANPDIENLIKKELSREA